MAGEEEGVEDVEEADATEVEVGAADGECLCKLFELHLSLDHYYRIAQQLIVIQ